MKKRLLIFCLLFVCFCQIVEAQLCNQSYEVPNLTGVHLIEQTVDEGYIVVGKVGEDIFLLKTDVLGNELWSETYSNEGNIYPMYIRQDSEGNYQVLGTFFDNSTFSIFFIEVEANGKLIDKKIFEISPNDSVRDIKINANNEIIVAGSTYDDPISLVEELALLLKFDFEGNQLSRAVIDDEKEDEECDVEFWGGLCHISSRANIVEIDNNDKPILAGSGEYLDYDIVTGSIATTFQEGSLGRLEWEDYYHSTLNLGFDFTSESTIIDLVMGREDNITYFISDFLNFNTPEGFTIGTIFKGHEIKLFPLIPYQLIQTTDQHFIISGEGLIGNLYTEKLLKVDKLGNLIWERIFEHPTVANAHLIKIKATTDGGFVAVWEDNNTDVVHLTKFDSYGYSCKNYIEGNIFADSNNNCQVEEGERAISDVHLKINNESTLTTVNPNGSYSLPLDSGTYNISISTTPDLWEANCEENYQVTFDSLYQTIENIDFALQASIPCQLMNIDVGISRARACREGRLAIEYCNDGNTDANNIRIELQISPLLENITSSTPFVEENGLYVFEPSMLEWGRCRSIYVYYQVVCDASIDEQVCVEARIFPNDHCGEARPIDESITCLDVTNSYDPNDIQVEYEQPIEGGDCVVENGWLDYTIRFQNTGNDTAYRVMVMDTLPQSVELESFRRGASSHHYELEFHQPNVLVWIFDNINLLDSLNNEPESHGFVSFSIRQKSENVEGLVIANQAHIYFDFNAPITTNIASVQNCLKTTLPVEITAFRGEVKHNGNFIEWETASEVNNDYFQLEHSQNGQNFERIATINSIGTTSKPQKYSFLHRHPFVGANYYRLSQVDLDGTVSYFVTISLHIHPSHPNFQFHFRRFYPNPSHGLLFIEFSNPSLQNLELELVNTLGQVVLRQNIEGSANRVEVDCSGLQKGLYLLKLGDVWEKMVVR
ncbi:MAG: T9SS type A sorting domain-containing protein [Chitinophagales bacterium]